VQVTRFPGTWMEVWKRKGSTGKRKKIQEINTRTRVFIRISHKVSMGTDDVGIQDQFADEGITAVRCKGCAVKDLKARMCHGLIDSN